MCIIMCIIIGTTDKNGRRAVMVKRYSDDGKSFWFEPPFSKEEEKPFAGLWDAPVQVARQRNEEPEQKEYLDSPSLYGSRSELGRRVTSARRLIWQASRADFCLATWPSIYTNFIRHAITDAGLLTPQR
jgi:hypothetical protein